MAGFITFASVIEKCGVPATIYGQTSAILPRFYIAAWIIYQQVYALAHFLLNHTEIKYKQKLG